MNVIQLIKKELADGHDEVNAKGQTNFFKEPIKTHGWRSGDVTKLANKYFDKEWSKEVVFDLCELLWQDSYMEPAFIACNWSLRFHEQYTKNDFKLFESWVFKYINNWATCDTFCNHTMGTFIIMYPEFIKELKRWSKQESRWIKRASAVSFIIPARQGLFLNDIFEIADNMMDSKDDLVQKGYGWALKAASLSEGFVKQTTKAKEEHCKKVYDFVVARKSSMPRTAYRYAIEKMPEEMKKKAMKK
jgi:3-methyladenine DNA glycosylase AlkD